MVQRVLLHVLAGIGGLWIAIQFIEGVGFQGSIVTLLIIGTILGILNAVVKPILNLITLPIRILTLGLSSLVINLLLLFGVDLYFEELSIEGIVPLLFTTLVIWGLTIPLSLFLKK